MSDLFCNSRVRAEGPRVRRRLRILQKSQTVADSPTAPSNYNTAYLYHPGGQVAQINYPSGLKVFYRKNAVGQISSVDTQLPGTTVPKVFLANIQYNGLGQPKAWDWRHCVSAQLANCVKAARTYDTDGRMTSNEFASYNYDAASRITALTQQMAAKRSVVNPSTGATSTQYFNTPLNFLISYDSRNRLTSFNRTGHSQLISYDSNGNRLSLQSQSTADTDLDNDQDTQDITTLTAQTPSLAPALFPDSPRSFHHESYKRVAGRSCGRSAGRNECHVYQGHRPDPQEELSDLPPSW